MGNPTGTMAPSKWTGPVSPLVGSNTYSICSSKSRTPRTSLALVTSSTAPDPLVGVGAEVEDVASRRPPSRRAPARADFRRERSVFHPALVGLVALLPITILALLDSKRSLPSPPPAVAAHGLMVGFGRFPPRFLETAVQKHSLECWAESKLSSWQAKRARGPKGGSCRTGERPARV